MIEKRVWSIIGSGRGLGVDVARGEPSHIHLPRRRRVARPDDQDASATRYVYVGDEERHEHAQPATYAQVAAEDSTE